MDKEFKDTQPRYRGTVKPRLHLFLHALRASPEDAGMLMEASSKPYSGTLGRSEGVDVSHWEGWFDPSVSKYRIDFGIMKLTEGTTWVDPAVDKMWNGVKQLPIRGGYHYYRSSGSWQAQADHFLKIANRYDFHILAVDVEGINNDLTNQFFLNARRFYDYLVQQTNGKKRVVLYTNKNYLQHYMYPIYSAQGGDWLDWLNKAELWYAQYYYVPSPDKNPSMPSQRSANNWDIYQYTEAGVGSDWGTGGAVDLNVFNGTYEQMLTWAKVTDAPDPPDPPPSDDLNFVASEYNNGIEHAEGWDMTLYFEYHISRVAWVNIKQIVTSAYKQFTNKYFLESRNVHLSVNSDEYYYPGYDPVDTLTAKGITCENGTWRKTTGWQAAQFDKDNNYLGISTKKLDGTYNTFAGSNWLVDNGVVNATVDNTSVDPRTILAGDSQYLYFVSIMGRNNGSQGATRREMAYWLKEKLNVIWAQNGDGGSSVSKNERGTNGSAVNLILNPGDGIENAVAGHFGIILRDVVSPPEPPPQGDGMYKVLADVNIRAEPSMYADSVGVARAGSTFDSNVIVDGVAPPPGKTPNPMSFIAYANGYIPIEYDNVLYVEQVYDEVMTIQSGSMMVELPDGEVVEGEFTQPVKLVVKK